VSLDEARGHLIVGTNQGALVSLSPRDLTLRWTQTFAGAIKSTAALVDDAVMVTAWDGNLHALSLATGELRFQVRTQDRSMSSPAVWDGIVAFGSHDKTLTLAEADTGRVSSRYLTKGAISSSPVMIRASGLALVGSCDGTLYAFDAHTGLLAWAFPLGTSITSVPVAVDHSLFVNDDRGTLWRLDSPD
jgi:outer membrane protein assembly factor BamB